MADGPVSHVQNAILQLITTWKIPLTWKGTEKHTSSTSPDGKNSKANCMHRNSYGNTRLSLDRTWTRHSVENSLRPRETRPSSTPQTGRLIHNPANSPFSESESHVKSRWPRENSKPNQHRFHNYFDQWNNLYQTQAEVSKGNHPNASSTSKHHPKTNE